MMKFILSICCCFFCLSLTAQDSILLDQQFVFEDGVYYSVQQLQKNSPNHRWSNLDVDFEANTKRRMLKVKSIQKGTQNISNDAIFAIVYKGKPHVKLINETGFNLPEVNASVFVEIQIRSKISYIPFQTYWVTEQEMPVYNPENGKKIKTYIDRKEEPVTLRKILNFETGVIKPFNLENFKAWIQDDPRLLETIAALSPEEAQQKLFKCLLIYNDRNYSYIRSFSKY